MSDKEQQLREFILMFLRLNPEPADAQYHALASSIAVDKEHLEALAYEMLGQAEQEGQIQAESTVDNEDSDGLDGMDLEDPDVLKDPMEASTIEEDVLSGDYDPATTSADDLALNDGELVGDDPDPGFQDETTTDGVGVEDTGLDLADKNETFNDGTVVPPKLDASARLKVMR